MSLRPSYYQGMRPDLTERNITFAVGSRYSMLAWDTKEGPHTPQNNLGTAIIHAELGVDDLTILDRDGS